MEETLKVNIGGVAFILNSMAYEILKKYIDALERHYGSSEEGKEIVRDIESRIAELLIESCGKDEIVTPDRVNAVIAVMGTPSDIESGDDVCGCGSAPKEKAAGQPKQARKRLYRDKSTGKIWGVCSGLGHYFKFDPTIIRAVFLVLSLLLLVRFYPARCIAWLSIITYIVLGICMPPARTYIQRCAMKGIDPGVKGAEESITSNPQVKGTWVGRAIKFLIGVVFVCTGVVLLIMFWISCFGLWENISILTPFSLIRYMGLPYMTPQLVSLVKICFVLLWLLPCAIAVYMGVRWIFSIKRPKYRPGLIAFILWIVVLIFLGSLAMRTALDIKERMVTFDSRTELSGNFDTLRVEYEPLPATYDGAAVEWEELRYRDWEKTAYVDDEGNVVRYPYGFVPDSLYRVVLEASSERSYSDALRIFVAKQGKRRNIYAYYPSFTAETRYVPFDKTDAGETEDGGIENRGTKSANAGKKSVKPSIVLKNICFLKRRNATKIDKRKMLYDVKDSLITIRPRIISKREKNDGNLQSIELEIPEKSVVIINKSGNKQ